MVPLIDCPKAQGHHQSNGIMNDEPSDYLAYMLRMWRVDTDRGPVWRASLESPHTGERRGFADIEALLGFLEYKTGAQPRAKPEPSKKGGEE